MDAPLPLQLLPRLPAGIADFDAWRAAVRPRLPQGARVPRALLALLEAAACCRTPDRWAFLCRVLGRWQRGETAVLSMGDPDGARLHAMAACARRAERSALAGIRFRERRMQAGPPRFVGWCTPAHDVLARVAHHYAARMHGVTWMIASPAQSVLWDGCRLRATGPLLPAHIGDELSWQDWRAVFAPARLRAELLELKPIRSAGQ